MDACTDDAKMVINKFLNDVTDQSMSDLIAYCKTFDLTDSQILFLAQGLARSGTTFDFPDENICDIPSTGGPASLSTLLCPLFLRLLGEKVLKLGVSGRPAGGIDVLNQIEGYCINPNEAEVREWFTKSGYVHFLANDNFTPSDSTLFNYRKRNNFLNIPCLVIASLLAKKLAVGLNKVGLDVRVGEFGNFGKTPEEARRNCKRFVGVANLAGIKAKCFITNGMVAQQPYIGRGESLLALRKIFSGRECQDLKEHVSMCLEMSAAVSEVKSINFTTIDIENVFIENVIVQHGNMKSFYKKTDAVAAGHIFEICAPESGFLIIDLYKIRDAVVSVQALGSDNFPDPCGVILQRKSGQFISKGDVICSYRFELNPKNEFEASLTAAFSILQDAEKFNNIEMIQ